MTDNVFLENKFKSYVDNLYVQVILAITNKEIIKIKHFVSDSIYHDIQTQMDVLNKQGYKKIYDLVSVVSTTIIKKQELDNKIVVEVELISKYLEYVVDEKETIISGNDQNRIEKKNTLVFVRKKRVSENNGRCPGCGANVDMKENGKCLYCGTIYDLENYDFILEKWDVI